MEVAPDMQQHIGIKAHRCNFKGRSYPRKQNFFILHGFKC